MKDRSDNPSHHERTFLPRSYISLRQHKVSGIEGILVYRGSTFEGFTVYPMRVCVDRKKVRINETIFSLLNS